MILSNLVLLILEEADTQINTKVWKASTILTSHVTAVLTKKHRLKYNKFVYLEMTGVWTLFLLTAVILCEKPTHLRLQILLVWVVSLDSHWLHYPDAKRNFPKLLNKAELHWVVSSENRLLHQKPLNTCFPAPSTTFPSGQRPHSRPKHNPSRRPICHFNCSRWCH